VSRPSTKIEAPAGVVVSVIVAIVGTAASAPPEPTSGITLPEPVSALPVFALPVFALPVFALPVFALPVFALPVFALPMSALRVSALPTSALPA
jgi:hypothetical protein